MRATEFEQFQSFVDDVQQVRKRTFLTRAEIVALELQWQEIKELLALQGIVAKHVSDLRLWLEKFELGQLKLAPHEPVVLRHNQVVFTKVSYFLANLCSRIAQLETSDAGGIRLGSKLEDDWRDINSRLHHYYRWFDHLRPDEVDDIVTYILSDSDIPDKSELMEMIIEFYQLSGSDVVFHSMHTVVMSAWLTRQKIALLCGKRIFNPSHLATVVRRVEEFRRHIQFALAAQPKRRKMH